MLFKRHFLVGIHVFHSFVIFKDKKLAAYILCQLGKLRECHSRYEHQILNHLFTNLFKQLHKNFFFYFLNKLILHSCKQFLIYLKKFRIQNYKRKLLLRRAESIFLQRVTSMQTRPYPEKDFRRGGGCRLEIYKAGIFRLCPHDSNLGLARHKIRIKIPVRDRPGPKEMLKF